MISMKMKKNLIAGIDLCHKKIDSIFIYLFSSFSSQIISGDTIDYSHRNLSSFNTNEILTVVKNPNRIKNVQLNSNILLTIPSEIEQFQSLITLELSNNQLIQLPREISLLKNLKNLYIKNNSLDDFSLPKEFDQLKQLEVINLGGNRLKQYPYQLFQMLNLKEIYLGSNQITFLPDLFHTLIK
jgi:Leucine-rich repeat (LRR) protein